MKIKLITLAILIGASPLVISCSKQESNKEKAIRESVDVKSEVSDMELFRKHNEITIKLAMEDGYIANDDINALIEEFKEIGTKESRLLAESLQAILDSNKEKSEDLYYEAMFLK